MSKKQTELLIAEGFPCFNKGEMAILLGMLETFSQIGSNHVRVFSFRILEDSYRYPDCVELIDIPRSLHLGNSLVKSSLVRRLITFIVPAFLHTLFIILYLLLGKSSTKILNQPLWSAYIDSDVIVFGHDGVSIVQGYLIPFSPLFLVLIARLLRKPVVIYANGTSAIRSKLGRLLTKLVVQNVALVTTRDRSSCQVFRNLKTDNPNIFYTGDPAVLAKPIHDSRLEEMMISEKISSTVHPLIGVTMTHEVLSAFQGVSNVESVCYKEAVELFAKSLDKIVEKTNATLIFIPHSIGPAKSADDRVVHSDIEAAMVHHERARVIMKEYSTEELKALIGQLDILIGARIHSVIAALSLGVPSCIISRKGDSRVDGLIGGLFKQSRWILGMQQMELDTLVRLILDLLENATAIRTELQSISSSVRRRSLSNGDFLRRVLITAD